MSAVPVNHENGAPWTQIVSGETVAQARTRFPCKGILENSRGVALGDQDLVRVEEAPYVFKMLHPDDEPQHAEKQVSLQMGNKEFQVDIHNVQTVEELTALAQTTFETTAALWFQRVEPGRPPRRLVDDSLVGSVPAGARISVQNQRVDFSQVTDERKALEILGLGGEKIPVQDQVFAPFIEGTDDAPHVSPENPHVQHAVETIAQLLTLVPYPRNTARLYMDAILIAAAKLEGGLELSVEEKWESPYVRGPVDYLFYYQSMCLCVTEGKHDRITHGIAQNVAQLGTIRYNHQQQQKREDDEIPQAWYGIATTFSLWVFTRINDTEASISNTYVVDPRDPTSIRNMIIRVVRLLRHWKGEVDDAMSSNKKQRTC